MQHRLARAWLQIVPSRWAEPFGLVTIEAMGRGTVVVASAVGAQPELIEHGRTGFLVPSEDIDTLSDTMATLLSCRERLIDVGMAARQRASQAFGLERITDRFIDLYQDVLATRRHPPCTLQKT